VVLIAVMYVADHPRLLRRYERQIVTLKSATRDKAEIERVLARKLKRRDRQDARARSRFREQAHRVDVRFRPCPPVERPPAEPAPAEPAAPVASAPVEPAPAEPVAPIASTPVGPEPAEPTPAEAALPV
jgi:hypothetical protein